MAYFLETDRLGFRTWRKEDLGLAMALWGDPEVTKFFDNRGKLDESQVKERLLREIKNQETYGMQYWPIFAKRKGKHIGAAGLRPKRIKLRQYEIGFHIRSGLWRQGYGREAARAVIHHAFRQLRVSSLFAGHNPQNLASAALLKKLYFEYSHDEYYEPTGLMHPSYILCVGKYNQKFDIAKG
jgi:RimJ/RimL family protein N-acetyltransferase